MNFQYAFLTEKETEVSFKLLLNATGPKSALNQMDSFLHQFKLQLPCPSPVKSANNVA